MFAFLFYCPWSGLRFTSVFFYTSTKGLLMKRRMRLSKTAFESKYNKYRLCNARTEASGHRSIYRLSIVTDHFVKCQSWNIFESGGWKGKIQARKHLFQWGQANVRFPHAENTIVVFPMQHLSGVSSFLFFFPPTQKDNTEKPKEMFLLQIERMDMIRK